MLYRHIHTLHANAMHIPSKCSCLLRYHIFLNQYPPLLLASDWSDLYLIMPQYMIKAVLLSLAAYLFIQYLQLQFRHIVIYQSIAAATIPFSK